LAKDVKKEIEDTMALLTGKGKGSKGKPKLKGAERKKMWDEVRALRKECVPAPSPLDGWFMIRVD
jgi:DNA polymerase alpha-associated DNA helicase A